MTVQMKALAPVAALLLGSPLLAACPGGGSKYPQPPSATTVEQITARLDATRKTRTSFKVQTLMDYWLGKDRAKGTVWVMGTTAKQVRFNALKPSGDVLVDMACDGNNFTFVDFQNNCQLAGPCNKSSIASLLRVELAPEDFHHMAQGIPPTISSTGTVTWDAAKGYERVKLEGPEGVQNLVIDARDGNFDVLTAELIGRDGKVTWSLENTDFRTVADDKDKTVKHRVPGKTRFKSPQENADLLVEWMDDQRAINLPLEAGKFSVPIPAGLPSCGRSAPTPAPSEASPAPKSP